MIIESDTLYEMAGEINSKTQGRGPLERAQIWDTYSLTLQQLIDNNDPTCDASPEELRHMYAQLRVQASSARLHAVERPKRGWLGLMTRGLPELPDVERPKREEFTNLRRYKVLPLLSLLGLLTVVILVVVSVPAMSTSPASAAVDATAGSDSNILSWIFLGLAGVVAIIMCVKGPKGFYNMFYEMALDEEIWFRLGAENFTWPHRIRSCIQFGFAHFLNLVVAIVTLGGLAVIGGVFMWVYMREYKESGDQRRAAATAAQFHADYNMWALGVLFFFSVPTLMLGIILGV